MDSREGTEWVAGIAWMVLGGRCWVVGICSIGLGVAWRKAYYKSIDNAC